MFHMDLELLRREKKEKLLIEWSRQLALQHWAFVYNLAAVIKRNKDKNVQTLRSILSNILKHPESYWKKSTSLPSIDHCLWIAGQLLICLDNENICEVAKEACWKAEISILKCMFFSEVGEEEIKHCKSLCEKLCNQDSYSEELDKIQAELLEFVLINCNPGNISDAFSLLSYMLPIKKADSEVGKTYIKHVNNNCEELEKHLLENSGNADCDSLLKLLKLLHCLPSSFDTSSAVSNVFIRIANLVYKGSLSKMQVYSFLVSSNVKDLWSTYQRIEDEICRNNSFSAVQSIFCPKQGIQVGELFLQCVNNKSHFLSVLLNYFQDLLSAKNYEEANVVLEKNNLSSLRPLIIINAWMNSKTVEDSVTLLKNLWNPAENGITVDIMGKLHQVCDDLALYSDLANWCLNKKKLESKSLRPTSKLPSKENDLLREFLSCSTLTVLKNHLKIKHIDQTELLAVLSKTSSESANNDVMVFRAYCAISYVIDAIMSSSTYSTRKSSITTTAVNDENSSLQSEANHQQNQSVHEIKKSLTAAQNEIEKIYPFSLRIEVLENIFSLLFLTRDNIHPDSIPKFEGTVQDSEYGYSTAAHSGIEKEDIQTSHFFGSKFPTYSFCRSISESECNPSYVVQPNKFMKVRKPKIDYVRKRSKSHAANSDDSSSDGFSINSSNNCSYRHFLCSVTFVQEFLVWFKNYLMSTTANVYNNKLEKSSPGGKKSSSDLLHNKSLSQTLSQLDQRVSEAQWRFELVASEKVLEQLQERNLFELNRSNSRSWSNKSVHSHCYQYHTVYSNELSPVLSMNKAKLADMDKKDKFRNTDPGVHSGSSSEKKRTRKWKKSTSSNSSMQFLTKSSTPVISRMFSSPVSLVNFCLINDQLGQAKQVIKMFQLQDSSCAKEVEFAIKLTETVEKVNNITSADRRMKEHIAKLVIPKEEILQKSTLLGLTAIAKAAAEGVASTTCTSMVDELLSSVSAPPVYEDANGSSKPLLIPLMKEFYETDVLVITDLSLTAASDLDVCNHLMNLASEKIPFQSSKMPTRSSDIPGFVSFFQHMFDLLQQMLAMSSSDIQTMNKSQGLPALLTQAVSPLSSAGMAQQVGLWMKVKQIISELIIVLHFDQDSSLTSSVRKSTDSRVNFKKLIYACSYSPDKQFLPIRYNNNTRYDYLLGLYDYLRQLTLVLQGCDQRIVSKNEESYFKVLREGPTTTIGRMAVENHVLPERLESLADKLNLDLTAILTNAVCPSISCYGYIIDDFKNIERIVLNEPTTSFEQVSHPELLARQLLTDLTQFMQEIAENTNLRTSFNLDVAQVMVKLPQCERILNATQELAFVDLDLLQTKQEKISFYVNVLNLMWIHAILNEIIVSHKHKSQSVKTENDVLSLNSCIGLLSSSSLHRFSCQASACYKIGQLGAISYMELRYGLFRVHLGSTRHIPSVFNAVITEKKNCRLWQEYAPPVETRSLFVLAQGYGNSPSLTILLPDMLQDQLEFAMSSYLNVHVIADCDAREVFVSSLLIDHEEDFCSYVDLEAHHAGLLNFVSEHVDESLRVSLNALSGLDSIHGFSENIDESGCKELPYKVYVYPEEFKFLVKFSWDLNEELPLISKEQSTDKLETAFGNLSVVKIPRSIIDYTKTLCPVLSYLIFECSANTTHFSDVENFADVLNVEPLMHIFTTHIEIYRLLNGPLQLNIFVGSLAMDSRHIWAVLNELSRLSKWQEMLQFLDMLPLQMKNTSIFQFIQDGILCMILENFTDDKSFNIENPKLLPWSYALRISDPELRCKYVLLNLESWPVEVCLQALMICLTEGELVPRTCKEVKKKLRLLTLYNAIMLSAKNPAIKALHTSPTLNINHWKSIMTVSYKSPDDILDILLMSQDYEVARDWAFEHCVDDFMQIIDEAQVCHLLEKPICDYDFVNEILSKYDGEKGVLMCLNVIKNVTRHQSILFVIEHMLKHLKSSISDSNIIQFSTHKIGLKMLQLIPEDKIESYENLTLSPHLLFEQLLMNSEVELAKNCLNQASEDISAMKNDDVPINHKNFNLLMEKYALKALDVRIVQRSEPKASPLEASLVESGRLNRSTSIVSMSTDNHSSSDVFVMPTIVPTREEWVPDYSVTMCMVCKLERFSMVNRRHHCRRCGRVVCTTCSGRKALVHRYGDIPVRVCDECCEQMTNPYSYYQSTGLGTSTSPGSYEKKFRALQQGSSLPNSPSSSSISYSKTVKSVIYNDENQWLLTIDEKRNDKIRDEFSYDQAPSISMCLSILALHSLPKSCGDYMLSLCDHLSTMLMPIGYKQANPEVDYGLVISMMKSLLLSAKVKFSEAESTSGVERCDLYLQCVALLNVLVRANCNHLIPSDKLTNNETVRRLRDQLVEEERWPLVLELSTKAGLDVLGIWATWGKFCLMNEEFTAARDKFTHCLKRAEKSHGHQTNPLLNVIINQLENIPFYGSNKVSNIVRSLSNLKKLQLSGPAAPTKNNSLLPKIYTECMYYLKSYGSHHHMVYFLVRHNLFDQALTYILENNCDEDVFIDSFLIPCISRSKLNEMESKISQLAPKKATISRYLIAACRVLDKRGLHHVLYRIQVFMQDDIRAAMMCIKFFQQCDTNYTDQFALLHYLYKASEHLNSFLESHETWSASKHSARVQADDKHCLILPAKDINRHINTVTLQITVTKFLKRCEERGSSVNLNNITQLASPPSNLLTLFGNNLIKAHLCAMVLVSGSNVSDGFGTACRIMQDFKLNTTRVYSLVSKCLISKNLTQEVFTLLDCIQDSGYKDNDTHDHVIFAAVEATQNSTIPASSVDELIKSMRSESKMIDAYILCGKLTQAYLLAIKKDSTTHVQRILSSAEKFGQNKVKNICEKWLKSKKKP